MHDQRNPRGSSPRNSSPASAQQDANVQRNLVGAGFFHRQGEFVLPIRAALRFERLESDSGYRGQR